MPSGSSCGSLPPPRRGSPGPLPVTQQAPQSLAWVCEGSCLLLGAGGPELSEVTRILFGGVHIPRTTQVGFQPGLLCPFGGPGPLAEHSRLVRSLYLLPTWRPRNGPPLASVRSACGGQSPPCLHVSEEQASRCSQPGSSRGPQPSVAGNTRMSLRQVIPECSQSQEGGDGAPLWM